MSDYPSENHQTDTLELDDQQKETQLVEKIVAAVVSEWHGPLPPAKEIQGYEDALPGAADRIFKMAEDNSKHRHEMERQQFEIERYNSNIRARDSLLGLVFAFIICMALLVGGLIVMFKMPNTVGTVAGTLLSLSGLGSVVGVFIKWTRVKDTTDD